jgi:hypothetical protein
MRHVLACVSILAASAGLGAEQVVFRAGVDLVTFGVTVTDRRGNLVTDLTRDDFEIVEDGRRQAIQYFAPGGGEEGLSRLHAGLMLDTSASMERDLRLARSAAIKFLNMLPESEDITLVDFDTEVRVTRYPQRDFPRVVERIRNRKPEGWTALYDALGVYLDGASSQSGRPILVMYTDGADSRSNLSDFELRGDQAAPTPELVRGASRDAGDRHQVLLGVTGSGKTFTMAQVVARVNRPTLVMAHNKTLAAQLYQEFRRFFPRTRSSTSSATTTTTSPRPTSRQRHVHREGSHDQRRDRPHAAVRHAVALRAARRHHRGRASPASTASARRRRTTACCCRSRGQRIDRATRFSASSSRSSTSATTTSSAAAPSACAATSSRSSPPTRRAAAHRAVRRRDRRASVRPAHRQGVPRHAQVAVYPKSHFVTPAATASPRRSRRSRRSSWRAPRLEREGKLLEAQRLHQRTMFDLEMLARSATATASRTTRATSRGEGGRAAADAARLPADDALVVVDESHQTVPQVRGMYHGDRSRKEVLVEYGFRLPSALDNRPLNFEEFEALGQVVYVSATPGPYELQKAGGVVVEQVIRPTGLMDPPIDVRPVKGQVDDLLAEIRARAERASACW